MRLWCAGGAIFSLAPGCCRGAVAPGGVVVHDLRSRDGISAQNVPPQDAEMPSGQQVDGHTAPWVGTTPWYQPTANEDIAPPAHQMPSGHIRHSVRIWCSFPGGDLCAEPVSYTHLTLPTISHV